MKKKYPKDELAKRVAIYEQLKKNYDGRFEIENGGGSAPKKNIQTLTEMKTSKKFVWFGLTFWINISLRLVWKWRVSPSRGPDQFNCWGIKCFEKIQRARWHHGSHFFQFLKKFGKDRIEN